MRRLLLSVMAGALGWALLAPAAAFAQFTEANIKGTYISTYNLNLNDPTSAGLFVTSAGLENAVHQIGVDVGKGTKVCPNLTLPSGISASDIKTVATGLVFEPGDVLSGIMQTTYDGAGSVIGEADFNVFKDAGYSEIKSIQKLNAVNSGFTSRICGGPAAASLDSKRCNVCASTFYKTPPSPPYNCALQYPGTNGSNPNLGGGGYITSHEESVSTTTPPTPNDISSISVLHFYISAFGLCQQAGSFAQCCNDPTLDMVMHIPQVNNPGTGGSTIVTQSFGVVGDPWGSGLVNSVLSTP